MRCVHFFFQGEGGLDFFFLVTLFPMCSHHVPKRNPQVLKLFPKTFPIAPQIYLTWFAQSSTLMYINSKGRPQWSTFVSILLVRVQRGVSIRECRILFELRLRYSWHPMGVNLHALKGPIFFCIWGGGLRRGGDLLDISQLKLPLTNRGSTV